MRLVRVLPSFLLWTRYFKTVIRLLHRRKGSVDYMVLHITYQRTVDKQNIILKFKLKRLSKKNVIDKVDNVKGTMTKWNTWHLNNWRLNHKYFATMCYTFHKFYNGNLIDHKRVKSTLLLKHQQPFKFCQIDRLTKNRFLTTINEKRSVSNAFFVWPAYYQLFITKRYQ